MVSTRLAMRTLLLALVLGACADTAPSPPSAPPAPAPATVTDSTRTLFDFSDDADGWRVVNDGVMGGDSQGQLAIEDGVMRFSGELVTAGGGFTSVRIERQEDLSDYSGVELRVRGGGRTFEVEVNDATRNRRREVSRRAAFDAGDEWRTVRIPFDSLESTAFGEPVDVGPLDQADVRSFGIFIADGQDGPFELEVDWIRAY